MTTFENESKLELKQHNSPELIMNCFRSYEHNCHTPDIHISTIDPAVCPTDVDLSMGMSTA